MIPQGRRSEEAERTPLNRYLSWAMAGLVVLLLLAGGLRPGGRWGRQPMVEAARPEVGYPAPDWILRDLEDHPVRLSDYRGKAVFLNFWATWCYPCRVEMPEIAKLQAKGIPDLVILGVDLLPTETSAEVVAAFMRENGYTWRVPLDAAGEVAKAYGVISIPMSFFVGRDGVIRVRHLGPMTLPLMEEYARRALAGR